MLSKRLKKSALFAIIGATIFAACGEEKATIKINKDAALETLGIDQQSLSTQLSGINSATIFPPPEIGKDYNPEFPEPVKFVPEDWQTNTSMVTVANPAAKKGGVLKLATQSWPPTIRSEGPNARLGFLSTLHSFIYESLLSYDPQRKEFVPRLATHWQIGEDKQTFRFRIDPNAKWSDGRKVTADDVVATVEHLKNPDRKDPSSAQYYEELIEYAKMIDEQTVEIKSKKLNLLNQIYRM